MCPGPQACAAVDSKVVLQELARAVQGVARSRSRQRMALHDTWGRSELPVDYVVGPVKGGPKPPSFSGPKQGKTKGFC